jgi:[ribosomal protein S5]-alanine N-acetyltransferase
MMLRSPRASDASGAWWERKVASLETERLRLRELRPGDEQFLASLETKDAVMQYIHEGAISAKEALQRAESDVQLASYRVRFGRCLIEIRDSHVPIGWIEVVKYHRQPIDDSLNEDLQLGYELHPEYWNLGYATEAARAIIEYAFEVRQLDRLVAYVRPQNHRSIRVLEKLGFRQIGTCLDDAEAACNLYLLTMNQSKSDRIE